ncbi:DHA3 family macrolide efflux protein-like MFS transporter [Enterococcus sp. PF1-24]|uniref:MFS transporter n=1 Tax=unclassified Enterococcus TaxID=2608891 RepID=UPI002476AB6C|nr:MULTISPECIES: MFS transporter [unclassified Enterococcus]MDH6365386.1 DHA3 family macrolide efflux protein-like MFS transporter [Enterococcus sp. PFB1-1]MDH6402487.1 DHA3 family macrolide efflux protein-like MFS transporter [Enterococcus sp. PF1-24]
MNAKKNINQLLLARGISEAGYHVYNIILPLLVLEMSASLTNVGLFYALIKIPSLILLPFLGVLVERYSRKKLLFGGNLVLLLIFAVQLLLLSGELNWFLLTAVGMLVSLVSAVNDISGRVIFTELVPSGQLEKYNGIKSVVDNTTIFIAPMVGTFLYGFFGIKIVTSAIFLLYVLATSIIALLTYQPVATAKSPKANVFLEMKEGLQFIKTKKSILAFFLLAMALNFFVASTEEIINPGILLAKYQIPDKYYGFSVTFNIIGVILGGLYISKNSQRNYQSQMKNLFIISSGVMIFIGGFSMLLFQYDKFIYYGIFLFLQVLLGFFTILINVPLTSYFQENVPLAYQGRFFSLLALAANFLIPFGIGYAGWLAQKIGADLTYIINNICVIIIVIFTFKNVKILAQKHTEK